MMWKRKDKKLLSAKKSFKEILVHEKKIEEFVGKKTGK